ncbi:MAG: TRAP transporter large permease [Alphaproteobacteria bacterium]
MIEFLNAAFTDVQLGFLGFVTLIMLVAIRIPLSLSLFAVGLIGLWLVDGKPNGATTRLADEIFGTFTRYSFTIIPLFILMGEFALRGGLGRALFDAASLAMGRRPGGGAMAAIGASAGFGAVCGSSLATASTIGKVALPELRRLGYSGGFATGTLAAGGTLGILIPPSLLLVIYSILAEQNIAKLFAAALIPGIFAAASYMVVIWFLAKMGQVTSGEDAKNLPLSLSEKRAVYARVWPVILIFILMFGGLYSGWFSPTTAASIGASGTGIVVWLQGRMNWEQLSESLVSALTTSVMILMIIAGANIFNSFLASAGIPDFFATVVSESATSPIMIIVGILLIYLLLGMIMDSLAMIFLTVPIFLPIVIGLDFGFSTVEEGLIWFGILVLMAAEIGLITPPVGLNLFVINSLSKDVPINATYKGVLPFIIVDLFRLGLLVAFPGIALWIVRALYSFVS